ncbi:MAG: allophanate hydrolase subunit 1, partial [Balneolales bacterium]|nr:allophanate hydrolase subunit 1 [Balneolales bacterium]
HESLIWVLKDMPVISEGAVSSVIFEVEVDYSAGLDWNRVEEYSKLSKQEVIQRHTNQIYTVAMIGFLPGFVFLDGLDQRISVPRLETPRTYIPSGSVGIGGNQTGFYSLESPGGWNIIGKTRESFFDVKAHPPSRLNAGDKIKFVAI